MFVTRMRVIVSALMSAIWLSGCSVAVLINTGNEQDKFAKTFSPPGDKALIYVYSADPNPNNIIHVLVDGRISGTVNASYYSISNVIPGPHRVGLEHEESNSILVDVEPGKSYFVDARMLCEGGAAHAQLTLVDESIGKRRVLASQLGNITLFGVALLNAERKIYDCSL